MDDLTGMNESASLGGHSNALEGQPKLAKNRLLAENYRRPLSRKLDLTGERMELQTKQTYCIGLDASKEKPGIWERLHQTPVRRWLTGISSRMQNQPSVEILRVVHACQNDKENFVNGWIDGPRRADRFIGNSLRIHGWLVGRKAQPTIIQVLSNATIILEIPINLPRPDILKAIPFGSSFCDYGFQGRLNLENLPTQTELHLQAVYEDKSFIPVGTICLHKYGF